MAPMTMNILVFNEKLMKTHSTLRGDGVYLTQNRKKISMKGIRTIFTVFIIVGVSLLVMSAYQVLPTGVRITVLNKLGNPVENAKVTMFANEEDYENEENAVAGPAFTDVKGRITFKNLDDKQYYVLAEKGEESNVGEAEQTGKLEKGKINKFNIIIE
jgi:outer membrane protein assembly factor BamB